LSLEATTALRSHSDLQIAECQHWAIRVGRRRVQANAMDQATARGARWTASEGASKSTIFAACTRVLEHATWLCRRSRRNISGASRGVTVSGARLSISALDLYGHFVALARRLLVVSGTWWRRWRWWGWWCWRRRRRRSASFDVWVNRSLPDAAFTTLLSRAPFNAPVTSFAMRCSPGILDLPILPIGSIGPVADNEHTMIEILATSLVLQDAARVVLENGLVRLDCDGDGLLRHSSFERSLRLANFSGTSYVTNLQDLGASAGARCARRRGARR